MFKSAAVSLIGGLLLRLFVPQQLPLSLHEKPPVFAQIPSEHYLGISHESTQQSEAFEDAIQNAIKQIIQKIGAEYQLEFEKIVYSENDAANTTTKERLEYEGRAAFGDIEVKSWYLQKSHGKYTGYVLVCFPQSEVIRARQFIETENRRSLVVFDSFMEKADNAESADSIVGAIDNYKQALMQADTLFKEKRHLKAIVESRIKNALSVISILPVSNYDQRNAHYISCKALYKNRPAQNVPVRFEPVNCTGFITPVSFTDSTGHARCDISVNSQKANNEVRAFIDIEGVSAEYVFTFSTVQPRPVVNASPLRITDDCFLFEVRELNDVEAVFNSYEVFIDAKHSNASFINYYIAHVDSSQSTSRSFDLLQPVKISGDSFQQVKIPFNSWIKQKTKELNKWYMGSNVEYRLVLKGREAKIIIQ